MKILATEDVLLMERYWLCQSCGSEFDSHWCGPGFWFLFYADPDADLDPTFQPDVDPDLDPSFQIKAQTLGKVCSNRIIFHTFLLSSANWCGSGCGSACRFLFDADLCGSGSITLDFVYMIVIILSSPHLKSLRQNNCLPVSILTVEYGTKWSRGFRTLWIYSFFRF